MTTKFAGTTTVRGRTRYADRATTRVSVSENGMFGEPVLVIEGGIFEFDGHADGFRLTARHATATDEEHDAAHVAYLEGAGFKFGHMMPDGFNATGVILKAKFYPEDPKPEGLCQDYGDCNGHGFLKFTPPKQEWKPMVYEFKVEYMAGNPAVTPKDAS